MSDKFTPNFKKPEQDDRSVVLKNLDKTFGDSGTERYNGYFLEEPNVKWRDEQRIDNVEEMRRTDGSIKAVLNALKAPILSAEWRVECDDEEKKEFVEENLKGMQRTFTEWLREALGYFDFGHYAFEILYKKKNGKIYLNDLAPRIPASIQDWQLPDGSFGITQWVQTDEDDRTMAEIPAEKLLILTNDKEGDDVTGQSVLRPAYKHYKYKDVLYRIQGISSERYGVGTPVIYLPENYGDKEKEKAEEMLKNLRSNQKGYIVIPWKKEDGELEILVPSSNSKGQEIEKAIDHHDKAIMRSVLAAFLGLGDGKTGSFALSKDQSSFFLKHVEDKAKYVFEQLTKQVVKRLMEINFGPETEIPQVKISPLGDIDFKEMSEVLKSLKDAGYLEPSDSMKDFVRNIFKLPPRTDEEKRDEEENKQDPEEPEERPDEEDMSEKKNFLINKEFNLPRKLMEQEQKTNFMALNQNFNESETNIEDELSEITKEEINTFINKAEKKLSTLDVVAIGLLTMSLQNKTRQNLEKNIKVSYDLGKGSATNELRIKTPVTPTKNTQIMNQESKDLAQSYTVELENTGKDSIRSGIITGASVAAIISSTRDRMIEQASKMITNMSQILPGQYINRGRAQVYFDNIARISKFIRSEVLDGRTCNMCLTLDKRVVDADDPIARMDTVHSSCRGVWVPVFVNEKQPKNNPIPKTAIKSFDTIDGRPVTNSFKQLKKPINKVNKKVQDIVKEKLK